jgi:ribonuclease-3
MPKNINKLLQTIEYTPKDTRLFECAVTHSSTGKKENNERLEFLGDAVIELVVSDLLFHHYPNKDEGELTKLRAELVCEPSLLSFAAHLKLGEYIVVGKSEEKSGGKNKTSILSDAVEAIVGAIYLDGGMDAAAKVVEVIYRHLLELKKQNRLYKDTKTELQELLQKRGKDAAKYALYAQAGPPHDPTFFISVEIEGKIMGRGQGQTKKAAEQMAAKEALKTLKN